MPSHMTRNRSKRCSGVVLRGAFLGTPRREVSVNADGLQLIPRVYVTRIPRDVKVVSAFDFFLSQRDVCLLFVWSCILFYLAEEYVG
ncbi:hypothetical protein CEXT_15201 [Caerostris extrusa]|uniref:Uncharacterized protein n=1 Tax=Caerostris extrusa TaxID=172846 RepID=A0AAV4WVC1_CAEEX|nr:hypothetical protein CEXT_15201 [Caerostris extrusa]